MNPTHELASSEELRGCMVADLKAGPAAWRLPEVLRQLEGDAEVFADVIHTFMSDSSQRLNALREAIGSRRAPDVRAQAHSLKGSSNQLGADRIATVCQQIERNCGEALEQDLLVLVDQMEAYLHLIGREMLAYVAALVASRRSLRSPSC